MSDLSKLDAFFTKNTHQGSSGTNVQRLDMCWSILSLSRIAHQMWRDGPFSQRNRTTERTVGIGVAKDREVGGGVGQNLKKGGYAM